MFRNALEPWHVIILAIILLLVFGAGRLPEMARSLASSLRIFRQEVGKPSVGTPSSEEAAGATKASDPPHTF